MYVRMYVCMYIYLHVYLYECTKFIHLCKYKTYAGMHVCLLLFNYVCVYLDI